MLNISKLFAFAAVAIAASNSTAIASATLGQSLGTTLPIGDAGIVGLIAAGVVGGIWLARRKR